jgi:hypothetical protein
MARDPIVDEVRGVRDAFARKHNYDVKRIVEALQKQPIPPGARVVSLPPKRIPKLASGRKSP